MSVKEKSKQAEKPEQAGKLGLKEAGREIVREQQVVTVQPQPQQKGGSVRELSDELERLSQRYGSSMEDWLYDQSAL